MPTSEDATHHHVFEPTTPIKMQFAERSRYRCRRMARHCRSSDRL